MIEEEKTDDCGCAGVLSFDCVFCVLVVCCVADLLGDVMQVRCGPSLIF